MYAYFSRCVYRIMGIILGISAFYHDAAAAIVADGRVIAAAQEERFTRKKHDAAFPVGAIAFCLEQARCAIDDLDAVVFYDKPLLKFERLLETYYAFAPKGVASFITSIPVWLKEKMFLKTQIRKGLAEVQGYDRKKLKLLFTEHHLSHAASAFYPSPYEEAAILTVDGVGEWATASICHGKGKDIKIIKELRFPHSLGLLYSAFTYFLGFRVNSGEYKLMGLAPYGDAASAQVKEFVGVIKRELVDIKEDGSLWLNQRYFSYATGLRMIPERKWERLFGFKRRTGDEEPGQQHANLALAIQVVTEEVMLLMAQEAKRVTGAECLCMAGGVALNSVANGKLVAAGVFKDVFITPASGDAGGALGAALAADHIYFDVGRVLSGKRDELSGSYLGPEVSEGDVVQVMKQYKAAARKYDGAEMLCKDVAGLIAGGNVVGWVQGRMEFGPRALGNRSILADPRKEEMQQQLNLKIKYRESFRPFAPAVLAEDCGDYFDVSGASPYMLLVRPVKDGRREAVPEGYEGYELKRKLHYKRSDIPAVTHVDFSARVQTVHEDSNPLFYGLIAAFKEQTGCAVLINTSFNVRGEPMVCSAEDAYRCFMRTEMDYLVIGNYLFDKREQPVWKGKDDWRTEFLPD